MKIHLITKSKNKHRRQSITSLLATALIILAASVSRQAGAQVYPEAYLDEALQNNPGLQAQQKGYEASLQQVDIASALPDPELSAGIFTPPMKRLMGNQWFDVRVMQMFPWFGTLDRQKEAAEHMAEGSRHQYRERRNRLYMEMTRLWLDIYKKEEQKEVIKQSIDILKAREDLIYVRYEAGQERSGLALDIYRMEIQIAGLENRREKLGEEKNSLVRSFNILVGREETAAIETPSALPETTMADIPARPETGADQVYDQAGINAFANNPQLNMAQSGAQAAETEKEISRLMTRPMLGFGLQYSWFAPGEAAMGQMEGGHMLMPMISVSLPIFRNKNRATRHQGQLVAEMEAFRESDQVNNLQTQWAQLESASKNLQRDHKFYSDQLEITRKAWDLVLAGYAAGDEGFDELLRLQDQLIDLEWRMLETSVNKQIKHAEMDMLHAKNIFE